MPVESALQSQKIFLIRNLRDSGDFVLQWRHEEQPHAEAETLGLPRLQEILERDCPDVIVLDLELPIHRGIELLRTVKAACPEAEIMTRVESRHVEPRFFSVRSSGAGLSLEPVQSDALARIPIPWRTRPLATASIDRFDGPRALAKDWLAEAED